jgi:hypothetical protein
MLPSPALEQPVEGGHAVDDRGSLLFRGLRERGGEWSEARRGQVALDPRLTGSASSMRTNRRSSGRALPAAATHASPPRELPDLGLRLALRADLGEDRDRAFELLHSLLGPVSGVK